VRPLFLHDRLAPWALFLARAAVLAAAVWGLYAAFAWVGRAQTAAHPFVAACAASGGSAAHNGRHWVCLYPIAPPAQDSATADLWGRA
jgi:hypothetical protein